jgi:ribosome-associated protein
MSTGPHNPPHPSPDDAPAAGVNIAPGLNIPGVSLRWSFSRSAGPGGQNVNKLATKAELRVSLSDLPIRPRAITRLRGLAGRRVIGAEMIVDAEGHSHTVGGELVLTSESERSQGRNKSECLDKLRELLVEAMAEPKIRRKTRPTRGSVQRRIESKKHRGDIKQRRQRPHD